MKFSYGEHYLEKTLTGTKGYGEQKKILDIEIKENFQGIISLEELYEKKLRNKHIFLEKLKEILREQYNQEIDPIKFLYYIYYIEKLSTIEIYDRLYKIGNYKNKEKNTFELMFKQTFGWKLRGNSEPSINTKKRQSINNGNRGKAPEHINNPRKELEEKEIDFLFNQIKGKTDKVLLIDLVNKKTLNQKVIYILYSLGFLIKENDEELANFIKIFQDKKIGFLKTAQIIKGLIIKITPEIENEINEQNLKKRLIERYKKYYK